jgi:hypothetical protein
VKWLNKDEKGLSDFYNFSSEMKEPNKTTPKREDKGNNIVIDQWAWS